MDELIASQDDLEALFHAALDKAMGTAGADVFGRRVFVRRMSRKLAAHFAGIGWPGTKEEVMVYVREAIDRYC